MKQYFGGSYWGGDYYASGHWTGVGVEVVEWTAPTNCAIATAVTMDANTITSDVTIVSNSVATGITMPVNSPTTDVGIGCGYQR